MNAALILTAWLSLVGFAHTHKALPAGTNYASPAYVIQQSDIRFLADRTYLDAAGELTSNQEIYDNVFAMIDSARKFILIDMFLLNDYANVGVKAYRDIAGELTERLIRSKERFPDIRIDLITDPINIVYGGGRSNQLEALKTAGINVITTDLTKLRDSNPGYSAVWRTFFQWFGNSEYGGLLRHPFSNTEPKVTLRSYLALLNFKANHRKVILTDEGEHLTAMVMSANPHNGSSGHSNVALKIKGAFCRELYATENGVAHFSESVLDSELPDIQDEISPAADSALTVRLITEKKIEKQLLGEIHDTEPGDTISIAMFYLSDRDVVEGLTRASHRGVGIRLILDPNRDAFGYEKNGIPNRQVADELWRKSDGKIQIRWYDTHGEQFHTKLIMIRRADGEATLFLGSANLTRRNIHNLNLETDLQVDGAAQSPLFRDVQAYYAELWSNNDGNHYTVDFKVYRDDSTLKKLIYRFQEFTGMCTF